MRQLQREHAAWLAKKYPGQPPKVPAVGCLEEAGELVHAVLKVQLVQTWGEDTRHKLAELRVKLVDAVGDCGIYACSLCNANGWDFECEWNASVGAADNEEAVDSAIRLCTVAAALALYPTNATEFYWYLCRLKTVAEKLGLDAETCIRTAWEEVRCR